MPALVLALALAACATAAPDPLAFATRQSEAVLLADEDGHPMIVPNGQTTRSHRDLPRRLVSYSGGWPLGMAAGLIVCRFFKVIPS